MQKRRIIARNGSGLENRLDFIRAIAFTPAEPIEATKPDRLEFGQPFCGGLADCALDSVGPVVTKSGRTCAGPTGSAEHDLCEPGSRLHET